MADQNDLQNQVQPQAPADPMATAPITGDAAGPMGDTTPSDAPTMTEAPVAPASATPAAVPTDGTTAPASTEAVAAAPVAPGEMCPNCNIAKGPNGECNCPPAPTA
jgi:hypothetical protein